MFVPTEPYDFCRRLEDAWQEIRDEGQGLPPEMVQPWVQRQMYGSGWSLAVVALLGRAVPAAAEHCPVTTELVTAIPGLGMAAFSRLSPDTAVEPHVGWGDRVYRFHLGLVVPPDCGIEVGAQTRRWEEGACLAFDDTVRHSAWNRSECERWVLMLDVLRPGRVGPPYDMARVPGEVQRLATMLGAG